jgi:hypothetical protein
VISLLLTLACLGNPVVDLSSSQTATLALTPGVVLERQSIGTWQGEPIWVPDPKGRILVLEAIRSADW